ncbi:PAS domain-containing protein [Brenneria populi]|uniref:PAS domain-containing protein n=1 Tax=Brenneria populi TaxID=1505588 RepID=UPI0032EB7CE2
MFCKRSGYTRSELKNKDHQKPLIDGEIRGHGIWWGKLLSGKVKKGEFIRQKKDGSVFWIHATYTRVINQNGECTGIIKVAQNITVSRLEELEKRYKSRAINIAQGIIEFDVNGCILKANKNFLRICKFSLHEIKGLHHQELCEEEYVNSSEYRELWKNLRKGDFVNERFKRVGKNKLPFWIHATYCPLRDTYGNVYKINKYAYNITDEIISSQISKK